MPKIIGYARTSTTDQVAGLEDQIRELKASGCSEIFSEQVSSVKDRAQLDRALAALTEGDALMVTKHDRLARSTKQFLNIIEDLDHRKIGIVILSMGGERIDSRSATGKLVLIVFAALAEFERSMMKERQLPGISKARAEGKYKGRVRSQELTDSALRLHAEGKSTAEIAAVVGRHERSIRRIVAHTKPAKIRRFYPIVPVLGPDHSKVVA